MLPDLRRSGALENKAAWLSIVHDGMLKDNGMASFKGSLTKAEMDAIREWIIHRANQDKGMKAER